MTVIHSNAPFSIKSVSNESNSNALVYTIKHNRSEHRLEREFTNALQTLFNKGKMVQSELEIFDYLGYISSQDDVDYINNLSNDDEFFRVKLEELFDSIIKRALGSRLMQFRAGSFTDIKKRDTVTKYTQEEQKTFNAGLSDLNDKWEKCKNKPMPEGWDHIVLEKYDDLELQGEDDKISSLSTEKSASEKEVLYKLALRLEGEDRTSDILDLIPNYSTESTLHSKFIQALENYYTTYSGMLNSRVNMADFVEMYSFLGYYITESDISIAYTLGAEKGVRENGRINYKLSKKISNHIMKRMVGETEGSETYDPCESKKNNGFEEYRKYKRDIETESKIESQDITRNSRGITVADLDAINNSYAPSQNKLMHEEYDYVSVASRPLLAEIDDDDSNELKEIIKKIEIIEIEQKEESKAAAKKESVIKPMPEGWEHVKVDQSASSSASVFVSTGEARVKFNADV